jgi:ATP-dependent helicase YprA (DUF1998 family)
MLVRRPRDRLCRSSGLVCIGTSATMASEGGDETRAMAVAGVASRLFGTPITPDAVIDESLNRATDERLKVGLKLRESLRRILAETVSPVLTDQQLKKHQLAVWIELQIGLEDSQKLSRRRPITLAEAAQNLSDFAGVSTVDCRKRIEEMLSTMCKPGSQRGGAGSRAFLAFKLHRFISGAGNVCANLLSYGLGNRTQGNLSPAGQPGESWSD